jgi:serine-type D-Ala-D-Ala carboxypeptidase/endopeptidase (penicillin-binding protein 4)
MDIAVAFDRAEGQPSVMNRADRMERRTIAAALAAGAALACAAPALALDRSLGADVGKPAVTGTRWTDAEIAALGAAVESALGGAKTLRGAHVGVYAIDARDGRVLYQQNPDDAFQPASTLKLLVGSAALDRLGPGFRFRTVAFPGAPVVNGEIEGVLMLRGSGDVLLDDKALAELPPALRAAGISAAHGVAFDEPADVPPFLPGWAWDDLAWYYAAPVSRLGLNDNQVTLRVAPGASPGAPVTVTVEPWGSVCFVAAASCTDDLGFRIVVAATTGPAGSESTLDIARSIGDGGADRVRLVGALGAGAKPESLSIAVPRPPAYAAAAAERALRAAGFRLLSAVTGSPRSAPAVESLPVWSHDSEPLRDMLADLWLPSDNVLAEELLRAVGATPPALQGSSADGIAWERRWLKELGVDTDAIALADGSGLSAYDRITPRDLVLILKHDWDGPNHDLVLDDLPIAGVRGTLKSSFIGTPAEKRVFAKTGSMSHVNALAGYLANAKHGAVIFAFLVDDWVGASADLRELRGRVLSDFVER